MEHDSICAPGRLWSACTAPKDVTICTDSDILAQDIYDREGRKFLSAYTSVNRYVKALLSLNGTDTVSVFAHEQQMHAQNPPSHVPDEIRRIFRILSSGRKVEFEQFKHLSESLFLHLDAEYEKSAVIQELMSEMRCYDQYTFTHSINVSFYSVLIAFFLGLPDELVRQAAICGLLHDIGKLSIPAEILNKPGALNEGEDAKVKRHVMSGFLMLVDNDAIDGQIKKAVLLHHERMDGSGYPLGVIPDATLTKIIAIADAYDAITSDRVYKKRALPFKAFEFFTCEGGRTFCREILGALLSGFSAMLVDVSVRLASGETAKIVYIPPQYPCRMIVEKNSRYTALYNLDQIREILPEYN